MLHPGGHMLFRLVLPLIVVGGLARAEPIGPEDFIPLDPAKARIGQLLFYDKVLSGNRNIACATCHHHSLAGADGLSLGIGEGGSGLGPDRTPGSGHAAIKERIPRNAPALWNLGHRSVTNVFHDGRVSVSDAYGNGFDTPVDDRFPKGVDNIIAAQALFPMTSFAEMAGTPGENAVALAVADGLDHGWPVIAARVQDIPEYTQMFRAAFDTVDGPDDVTIVEVANAIGAFIGSEWQSYDSPYDALMRHGTPLPDAAERGRRLFFGEAGCASCHNGPLFTDQQFHATGLPAFGPGRTRPFDPIQRDVGRMAETGDIADAYKFRTPGLRNVDLTGPYGHNGAYPTLSSMIRHMANPLAMRAAWRPDMARLPKVAWLSQDDFTVLDDQLEMARQEMYVEIEPVMLTDSDVADIEAFLRSLTGKSALDRPLGRPDRVPSGLPVD